MRIRNFYTVLGVANSATEREIRTSYLRLANRFHPDKNPGDAHALTKFDELSFAYRTLKDPIARAAYDAAQKPIRTVAELFSVDETGRRVLDEMLPTSSAGKIPGAHALMTTYVDATLFKNGGNHLVVIPVIGYNQIKRSINVTLAPGSLAPRWFRIGELGFIGTNSGPCGDLWIVVLPTPTPTSRNSRQSGEKK